MNTRSSPAKASINCFVPPHADSPDTWGVRGTLGDAFAGIAAGIQKTGIAALRQLFPTDVADVIACEKCHHTGFFGGDGQLQDIHGRTFSIVCTQCAGLGWTAPSLDLTRVVVDSR